MSQAGKVQHLARALEPYGMAAIEQVFDDSGICDVLFFCEPANLLALRKAGDLREKLGQSLRCKTPCKESRERTVGSSEGPVVVVVARRRPWIFSLDRSRDLKSAGQSRYGFP